MADEDIERLRRQRLFDPQDRQLFVNWVNAERRNGKYSVLSLNAGKALDCRESGSPFNFVYLKDLPAPEKSLALDEVVEEVRHLNPHHLDWGKNQESRSANYVRTVRYWTELGIFDALIARTNDYALLAAVSRSVRPFTLVYHRSDTGRTTGSAHHMGKGIYDIHARRTMSLGFQTFMDYRDTSKSAEYLKRICSGEIIQQAPIGSQGPRRGQKLTLKNGR